ncbi:ABC transporter ATP-binding protein [Rhodobacter calidifons]|uniref:ABC transporter ATP-binding protein n=1 Tax=Rhodobacter calidifons TaxID=2715277 RepID=A0ABX0GC01_9RHOB|nr:ABC transporter ATP-binding protein [Rhodobacter calidifons]NHB78563.1 ABC transporter ATP-binding protein [Rhodobacter calidifons]
MTAHLELQGCSWVAPGGRAVLAEVSLALPRGRIVGIVGPNGAGKSTLLRLIYRYLRPSQGQVLLEGADLWAMDARSVARQVAAVLQEQPTDFALTVREIVALGRAPHRRGLSRGGARDAAVIGGALDRLRLSDMADRRIGTLSGGERQRVMIARALAQEPALLVLDEPTNHLDIRHQLEALALICDLGLTIVVSLHDLNLAAATCDAVLLLDRGRVVAQGPPGTALTPATLAPAFAVAVRQDRLALADRPHLTFHLDP